LSTSSKSKTLDAGQMHIWLVAVARQDALAFRALYEATSPKLFGFVLRILQKRELAEEVLQESFVNIWNNAGSYQSSLAAPMTWMTTIVRNRAFDLLRKLSNGQQHDLEIDAEYFDADIMSALESGEATPLQALELSQDAAALASCMARLEALHRQAMALAFYHDLSHSEVAEQMNLPMGTVKTWIRRGLDKLRTCLVRRELA
jgi:RNA polymerase sigma factor (sigma-70 family)